LGALQCKRREEMREESFTSGYSFMLVWCAMIEHAMSCASTLNGQLTR
jgi:hypothetical protein